MSVGSRGRFRIVLTTCGSLSEARRIGRKAVEKRLAACANIVPRIESIYRWKGNLERSSEILVIMKTTARQLKRLERHIEAEHSYELPEFVVLPLTAGSRKYFQWIEEST